MEDYLFKLGSHFKEIRNLLDWTQEDIASKIGVSRNTIVNIEQNPFNMKKTIAYSLYMIVYKEINERKKELDNIDFSNWDKNNREDIIKKFTKVGLTGAALSSSILFPVTGAILGSIAVTSSFLNLFSSKKDKSRKLEDLDSDDIKMLAFKAIARIKDKLEEYFQLEDIHNTLEFVNMVDKD
ncbi:MAG: helix-turn-helix transcriptional regulator [Halanaerobiales bacterium]